MQTGYPWRPAHRRNRKKRTLRVILTLLALAPIAVAGILGGLTLYRWSQELPDVRQLGAYRPSQTTTIYSSDGVLLARLFEENRVVVPLTSVSPDLIHATIAVEDHRFYEHRGVDWRGIGRALIENVRHQDYSQGGSTITQQLVRNVYLSPQKRLERKAKEAMLALAVERRYSKAQILQMYLNEVYYGERSFGVEAASRRYFGKHAKDLTLAEAALLAGLPQRPSAYDPYADRDAALKRRNLVLKRMAETGYISARRAKAASLQPLHLGYRTAPRLTVRRAPYFVDYVVRQLEDRYGAEQVYRGGLRVQTTLNTRVEAAAEEAVTRHMRAMFGRRPTQAALVCTDPNTGYIRAMVGGRDYRRSVFNRAVQARRQPGSSFKPFVYAAALNVGLTPFDRITDSPIQFKVMDTVWRPKNYDHRWHGQMTLATALAQSVNIPAIKLLDTVGPEAVIRMAKACGITSPLEEHLSLALGTSEVSVLEMASAYGTFATGGSHTDPIAIVSVKDSRGTTLEANYPLPDVVMDPVVAQRLDFMLRQVVLRGTGRPAGIVPEARGKTGTTDDLKDAWFVGYTPRLVTAVWVGNDTPSRIGGLTGSGACAPIWADFMNRALAILPAPPNAQPQPPDTPDPSDKVYVAEKPGAATAAASDPFAQPAADSTPGSPASPASYSDASDPSASDAGENPDDVVTRRICADTGELAGPNCPHVDTVTFARGTEPTEYCTLHRGQVARGVRARTGPRTYNAVASERGEIVLICRDSGGLAGPGCKDLMTVLIKPGQPLPKPCRLHSRRSDASDTSEGAPDRLAAAAAPTSP